MQEADVILSILSQKPINFKFDRIYRHLFNMDFYKKVINNISKENGFQSYIKKNNINIESLIENIIEELKVEKYYPKDLYSFINKNKGRSYFNKNFINEYKEDGLLNIYIKEDNLEDYILQYLVKEIVESIFTKKLKEKEFFKVVSNPEQVIKCFCNIKHFNYNKVIKINFNKMFHVKQIDVLNKFLKESINDGRFIELINRFIKSNYFRFYEVITQDEFYYLYIKDNNHLSSILWKVFFLEIRNILDELISLHAVSVKVITIENEILIMMNSYKDLDKFLDDFKFLMEDKLGINNLKEYDLNVTNTIEFCHYDIRFKQDKINTRILVPSKFINKASSYFKKDNVPFYKGERINLSSQNIIRLYNSEIETVYEYYKYAEDVNYKLRKFRYYHKGSMLSTIARKENTSIKSIKEKYKKNLGYFSSLKLKDDKKIKYFTQNIKKTL
ncbi:hypothetical protein KQI89_11605 [Clostridium sp. MSJ-4]|uniref:Uncharacterized protein n=1 Tax=Clostridium simiarum TaxID=2841506 RepID=A0ABS6F3G1_9CLOT|nr:hypothetical protein [Clostridium simiarum]MBU5592404.1 hypothetical protein [Clostridium simiarum]